MIKRLALAGFLVGLALAAFVWSQFPSVERARHCGCSAGKTECEEPCIGCCGPNGYADCRQNPTRCRH